LDSLNHRNYNEISSNCQYCFVTGLQIWDVEGSAHAVKASLEAIRLAIRIQMTAALYLQKATLGVHTGRPSTRHVTLGAGTKWLGGQAGIRNSMPRSAKAVENEHLFKKRHPV
jgi:hypothetical protein